jgi:acyl carrier protein phosphodiesterase
MAVPHPVPMVIEKMVREDWLRRYGTVEGIDRTFRSLSMRLQRENTLDTAVEELERNYVLLQDHFHCFFPQLMERFRTR